MARLSWGSVPRRAPGPSVCRWAEITGSPFLATVDFNSQRDARRDPPPHPPSACPASGVFLGWLPSPCSRRTRSLSRRQRPWQRQRPASAPLRGPPQPGRAYPHGEGRGTGFWGRPGPFLVHKGRRERPGAAERPHFWSRSAIKRIHFEHGPSARVCGCPAQGLRRQAGWDWGPERSRGRGSGPGRPAAHLQRGHGGGTGSGGGPTCPAASPAAPQARRGRGLGVRHVPNHGVPRQRPPRRGWAREGRSLAVPCVRCPSRVGQGACPGSRGHARSPDAAALSAVAFSRPHGGVSRTSGAQAPATEEACGPSVPCVWLTFCPRQGGAGSRARSAPPTGSFQSQVTRGLQAHWAPDPTGPASSRVRRWRPVFHTSARERGGPAADAVFLGPGPRGALKAPRTEVHCDLGAGQDPARSLAKGAAPAHHRAGGHGPADVPHAHAHTRAHLPTRVRPKPAWRNGRNVGWLLSVREARAGSEGSRLGTVPGAARAKGVCAGEGRNLETQLPCPLPPRSPRARRPPPPPPSSAV